MIFPLVIAWTASLRAAVAPLSAGVRLAAPAGVVVVTASAAVVLAAPSTATAQSIEELTATPEAAAALFLRSVRAIRWSAAAQFIDDETLRRFDTTVSLISDPDSTGQVRGYLLGVDSAGHEALDHATVFERAIGTMIDDMPGLMHSIFDRDDTVLGHVPEGAMRAHVVYRTTARISGAVPEVKVMQMIAAEGGWHVAWSDELEILEAALRGVPRARR